MTRFRVKLDEHLGESHRKLLENAGYDAATVHGEGLSGTDDDALWRLVCTEGRLLITMDLGFSDLRRIQPGSHPGVLLLRPRSSSRQAVVDVLSRVLQEHQLDTFRGCLAVADLDHTRVRRPVVERGAHSG